MILRNHGLLTCGNTISEAFILMYYLDRACKNQIDVLSTGLKPNIPSDNIMEYAAGGSLRDYLDKAKKPLNLKNFFEKLDCLQPCVV